MKTLMFQVTKLTDINYGILHYLLMHDLIATLSLLWKQSFKSVTFLHTSTKATYTALTPNKHAYFSCFCQQMDLVQFANTRFSTWSSRGTSLRTSCWESDPKFSENRGSFSENLFFILPRTSCVLTCELCLSVLQCFDPRVGPASYREITVFCNRE